MVKVNGIDDGGELTHSYSVESGGEVKMTKHEIIAGDHRAGFEAVERDTVYNKIRTRCRLMVLVKVKI